MKNRLESKCPVGKDGRPLAASTLKQYGYDLKKWPNDRERLKKRIREEVREVKLFSHKNGKVISRGKVSLQLIYGGKHPVRVEQYYEGSGWTQIR